VTGIGHSCDNAMRTVIDRHISEIGSAVPNDRPPLDALDSFEPTSTVHNGLFLD
jgi:hypothetical protein